MAQWDVYPNPLARARDDVPYLVVIQSDFLDHLRTRMVVPLSRRSVAGAGTHTIWAPVFRVDGESLCFKAHEAGALATRSLAKPIANLRGEAHVMVAALDAVISGV